MPAFPRRLPAALGAAALAVALAGCGAGGDGSGGAGSGGGAGATTSATAPAVTKDAALAAKVPQTVSADGKIFFGTDASYPPNEFTEGDKIVGMDVDLGTAVAEKLGLTAEWENAAFTGLIAGVESGKYELSMSSFTVNPERVQTVDMVSYFSAGTSIAVAKGNPQKVDANNLCGLAIGVQAGTVQVDDIAARSTKCTGEGKAAITVTELQQQTDVTLALTANRIVAMLADSPVVAYAVTTTEGALEPLGEPYDTAPYGIVLKKGQADYGAAVQGAVAALIADGTYADILKKWNVSNGAITTPEVSS